MKVNLLMDALMEKEKYNLITKIFIKDNLSRVFIMDMENINRIQE